MKFWEQVYTSAARLLEPSASNLGVIAQTRDFPAHLEPELSLLRSYTPVPHLPANCPAPPRYVISLLSGRTAYYSLTQVVYKDADHTGRRTPLAHHLLFPQEMLSESRLSPSQILGQAAPCLLSQWQGSPQWIDPPRQLTTAAAQSRSVSTWEKMLGPRTNVVLSTAVGQVLLFPELRRPVVICVAPDHAATTLALITELLTLLPAPSQANTKVVSHVVEPADALSDAALLFTYPGSHYLRQQEQRHDPRRPLLLDLTQPAKLPDAPETAYGAALLQRWDQGIERLARVAADFVDWGFQPKSADLFGKYCDLHDKIRQVKGSTDITPLGALIARCSEADFQQLRDRWGKGLVVKVIPQLPEKQREEALSLLAVDARWPTEVRQQALAALISKGRIPESLTNQLNSAIDQVAFVADALRQPINSNPALLTQLIESACSNPRDGQVRLVASVMSEARPDFATAGVWCRQLAGSPPPLASLLSGFLPCLLSAPVDLASLDAYCSADFGKPAWMPFASQVVLPLLKHQIVQATHSRARLDYANRLILVALRLPYPNAAVEELRWLMHHWRPEFSNAVIHQWIQAAGANNHFQQACAGYLTAQPGFVNASRSEEFMITDSEDSHRGSEEYALEPLVSGGYSNSGRLSHRLRPASYGGEFPTLPHLWYGAVIGAGFVLLIGCGSWLATRFAGAVPISLFYCTIGGVLILGVALVSNLLMFICDEAKMFKVAIVIRWCAVFAILLAVLGTVLLAVMPHSEFKPEQPRARAVPSPSSK